eukprot:83258-Rhodomonas_salina.3
MRYAVSVSGAAICLRTRSAMSGTDISHDGRVEAGSRAAPSGLTTRPQVRNRPISYAISGTRTVYHVAFCQRPATRLPQCYAMSGTEAISGSISDLPTHVLCHVQCQISAWQPCYRYRLPISLCACYDMSCTDIAHSAPTWPSIVLCVCKVVYGTKCTPTRSLPMSGTDIGYAATSLRRGRPYGGTTCQRTRDVLPGTDKATSGTHIAMACTETHLSGTDIGYAATRHGERR